MMILNTIFSERSTKTWPAYQIVYEWENILSDKLGLKIRCDNYILYKLHENLIRRKFIKTYKILNRISQLLTFKKEQKSLWFVMAADIYPYYKINKNTIPVIIDFWLVGDDVQKFIDAYKDVPLMLVTNREVYDLLKNYRCPFPVEHWALSYPDNYNSVYFSAERKFEFSIIGRPNPFFIRLLDKYSENHSDFTYIRNNGNIEHREYIDNKGNVVARGDTREDYLNMIRNTKISCYTTPGLDEAKKNASGFNQVTPRLFELLSNGCQIIGHYPISSDTIWYNLQDVVPNVETYEEFEMVLNNMRVSPVDYNKNMVFMNKHTTSSRVVPLIEILKKYNIKI